MISLIPSPWKAAVPLEISPNILLNCVGNVIIMLWYFVKFVLLFNLKKEFVLSIDSMLLLLTNSNV